MRLAILLLAAGCATVSKPLEIAAKDGGRALFVECRGSIARCHAAAQQQCSGSYIPLEDNRRASIVGDVYGTYTVHRFEMTFRCK